MRNIGSGKVFTVPNRLVEELREQIRMDGEEGQEIEITLTPIKRRQTVFPYRLQKKSEVTGKVI